MPPTARPTNTQYDGVSITLHWTTALLVVSLYGLAQLWDLPGKDTPLSERMQGWHVSLGIVLAVLLVFRLAWRATHPAPQETDPKSLMIRLAHLAHWGLYALLLALVPLGFAIRWSGNHPLSFFGLIDILAAFRLARPNARSARELHELAANILMALAGLHAAAALFHQYVLRDGVLARMLPAAWLSRLGLSPGNTQMLEPR